MNKKAIIFLRVSTVQQNLDSQKKALYKRAEADGFSSFIEIAEKESAVKLSEERSKGLLRLREILDSQKIDSIYIWELSRLSRQPKILYSLRDIFLNKGIQLVCLNPCFNLLTNDRLRFEQNANLIFSLFGALAEQETIEKKERFARGKALKAEQGKYAGGAIPFGYKIARELDNLIVEDEVESQQVREIFKLYQRNYSIKEIVKELKERGLHRMTISLVHQILSNESYTGKELLSKNASYPRKYPALITEEEFMICKEKRDINNTALSKSRSIYYADKLIVCPECNRYFTGNGGKNTYRCYNAYYVDRHLQNYHNHTCNNKSTISINIIDSLLWQISKKEEYHFLMTCQQNELNEYKEQVEILETKIKDEEKQKELLKRKKERLYEVYLDGYKEEKYVQRKQLIKEEELLLNKKVLSYKTQLEKLKDILNEALSFYNIQGCVIPQNLILKNKVNNIEDDSKRQQIVRKHIRQVLITKDVITHEFNIGKKETKVKVIDIELYNNRNYRIIFMPFDGKGGSFYIPDKDSGKLRPYKVKYLNRYYDKTKLRKKAE